VNGPVDNCPGCLTPERSVPVRPYLTEPEGQGAVRSYYRCQCGHRWNAGRLLSDEEMAEFRSGAA
jgi:hypothetical protein